MSTLIQDDYLRYYASLGGAARSGLRGTAVNEITLNDSTNATTSQVALKNVATPVAATDAVNKSYVDGLVISGVTWKNAANAATVAGDMTASTYSAAGLGTITWVGTPTIDTVTVAVTNRIVVQNSAASGDTGGDSRGIYTVTAITPNLVLTRSTDAAAASQANGAAIFVFDGSVNNDKAFVVTNDATVTWNGGVVFSIMSSVPAVVVGGSDTQVQYNNGGALGADGSFTYNKTPTVPVLAVGGAATGLTTVNLGTGSQASTVAGLGTGLLTVSGAGATTVASTTANLTLRATTSGNVVVDTATNDWTFNGTTLSSQAAAIVASTAANLTLQAATSGNVIVDTATNDWTFNGTSLTSQAAASVVSTSANLTLQAATSGNVIVDTATNDWTFNGTTLSSQAAATIQATSGNIVLDTATNDWTFNGTSLTSQAAATFTSTAADLTLSTTTSGNVVISSASITPGASDLTGTNLSVTGQTVTAAAAENYSFSTFGGTVAGTTTGFVTGALFQAPSGGTVTSRFTTALAGSTSGYLGFSAAATTTTYGLTWPNAVAGGSNYSLVSDTAGSLSWVAPGSTMLALPENQIYVGDAGTAVASGVSVTVDQNNIVATPTLNIAGTGNTVASTSGTINLGTASSGADVNAFINLGKGAGTSTIEQLGSGTFALTAPNMIQLNTFTTSWNFSGNTLNFDDITQNVNLFEAMTDSAIVFANGLSALGSLDIGSVDATTTIRGNVVNVYATTDFTTTAGTAGTISLFDTTTTGAITMGSGLTAGGSIIIGNLGNLNIAGNGDTLLTSSTSTSVTATSSANLFITTNTGNISMTSTGSGNIDITTGFGDINISTNSNSVVFGSALAELKSDDLTRVGSGCTLTNVDGVTLNVGTVTNTTLLNLFAKADGGLVNITAGLATTIDDGGGQVTITSGAGNGTGDGGDIVENAGAGGADGTGGGILLTAGAGGATSGAGGQVTISGGDAVGTDSSGGSIFLLAGSKTGTGNNGNIKLTTGGGNTASGAGTDTFNIISFNNTSGIVARMESDGRFYAPAFQTTSDATHKMNINRLSDPLERIKRVEGYSYNWKPEFSGYRKQLEYGVTAQQLEEAGFENLVNGTEDGTKTVNYQGLIPFLIEAIKELAEKVETTENLLKTERKRQMSRRE